MKDTGANVDPLGTHGQASEGAAGSPKKRPRGYRISGLYAARNAIRKAGIRAIDGRSKLGRAVRESYAELGTHLGGEPSVTQRRLIESVVVCDVLLTAGTGALERYGPIDKRRGVFRPIVKDLLAIIERRRVLCCDLGLERKQRDVPTLAAYLKAKESDSKPVTIEAAS